MDKDMFAVPKRIASAAVALLMSATLAVQPAIAQRSISFIRDTEIEHILRVYSTPILQVAGVVPESVTIAMVNDDSLNAFVAGGQNMFFHTGFLMDTTVEELVGVTAHETGHIAGGHLARAGDAMSNAATIASIFTLLGMAAAIGAGRTDVGIGLMGGGQEAAMRTFFAFTRGQEGSADEAAMIYLEKLGWSSEGLMKMMQRLAGQDGNIIVWTSKVGDKEYLALFNLGDSAEAVKTSFAKYGLTSGKYSVRDVWNKKDLGSMAGVDETVVPHGVLLLELRR